MGQRQSADTAPEQLSQPIVDGAPRFVVFDWDGTAVSSREPDAAGHLISPLEEIIEHGIRPYIVTGTKHDWAAAQLVGLHPDLAPRIIICCNRGSEVYRLHPEGAQLLHRQQMTGQERRALTDISTEIVGLLADAGHDVGLVSDRLNRIKVDLLPEWTEPPKHHIDQVVALANERYRHFGGLPGLLELTSRLVSEVEPDLRVTSDAKHIEIGITDKSHSMNWVVADIARHGGTVADLVVIGDEFGPIGNAEGSDAKTAIVGATVYSVGREPNGVPHGISHLGGGPEQLVRIFQSLVRRWPTA